MVAMTQLPHGGGAPRDCRVRQRPQVRHAVLDCAGAEAMCTAGRDSFTMTPAAPAWNGFGQNASNTRFQNAPGAGLSAADVPKLKLKWAFACPETCSRGRA
jgi:hypothetical protein